METAGPGRAGSLVVAGLGLTGVLYVGAVLSFIAWGTLAEIAVGLDHAGGPVLARLGLTGVHAILAKPASKSRRAAADVGGATFNAEASILAQARDLYALAHGGLLAGQWEATERPCPSLQTQALKGGPTLEAPGGVRTRLLGTQVQQSLAAAACVARVAEAAGTLRRVLAGCLVPAGAVGTAGLSLLLTARPLEASSTEAGKRAWLVHTGAPVEARSRLAVVQDGLAAGACVTRRAGAGVALRAGAAGAAIEAGL